MEHQTPNFTFRPMGIGDLLDRAIYFYRTHFIALVAYIALFVVPFSLLTALPSMATPGMLLSNPTLIETNPEMFGASYLLSIVAILFVGLLSAASFPLQVGGVGIALYGFLIEERQVSLREMIEQVRAQLSPLLGTGLLGMLLSAFALFFFILPPVGMAISTLYSFALYFAIFVVLYEKRTGIDALRRGWILVCNNVRRTLGYLMLFLIFSLLLGGIIGGLVVGLAAGTLFWVDNPLIILVAQTIATTLTSVMMAPLQLGVVGLLYFDFRIRDEGLDVAFEAAQAAGEPFDLAAVPVSNQPILNDNTWRAIGTLSAIYTVILGLFCGCIMAVAFMASSF